MVYEKHTLTPNSDTDSDWFEITESLNISPVCAHPVLFPPLCRKQSSSPGTTLTAARNLQVLGTHQKASCTSCTHTSPPATLSSHSHPHAMEPFGKYCLGLHQFSISMSGTDFSIMSLGLAGACSVPNLRKQGTALKNCKAKGWPALPRWKARFYKPGA